MYPDWINGNRHVFFKGRWEWFAPSESRVSDRKAIFDIIRQFKSYKDTVDEIINYFREKYEGTEWTGLSKQARRTLWQECKGICYWCKKPVSLHGFTVEHIVPQAVGGKDEWSNYAVAHAECNNERGNGITDHMGFHKESTEPELTSIP